MSMLIRTTVGATVALFLLACSGGEANGTPGLDPLASTGGVSGGGGGGDAGGDGSSGVDEVALGVIIGEAEDGVHQAPVDDWSERADAPDYLGSGYLVWKYGSSGASQSGQGQGVIHYPVPITLAGTYTLKLRMRKTPAAEGGTGESDKHNDAFVGFLTRPIDYGSGILAAGDTAKMYGGGLGSWQWGGKIDVHGHAHGVPTVTFPDVGTYTLVISGRSNLLQLDRWALVHEDATGAWLDQPLLAAPSADG